VQAPHGPLAPRRPAALRRLIPPPTSSPPCSYLHGNRLGALPGGLFDALANLVGLRLENNRIPALPAGLFAATTRLQFLWLHGNLIATAPSALLAGLPGGLRGRTGYGRPRLLLAPNPLVCRPSSGENLWSAARDDAVRCSGCAQGYEAGAGSSAGHVSCVRPPFQPNPGPNSTVQRALASIRSVLARRSNGTVFLGEPLDPYAAADAADAADAAAAPVRSFEPKRDNFLGYATAAGASFDDVRFSAALTDLDISCGDVVVGDLTDARRSVPSAIAVPTSFAGSVPTRLFTTPQRYLRFRVLRAGGARFSFDACGSRFGATIAVYSATTTAPSGGGGGGGGSDRRRDIVAGGTDDFYQGSLAGMDGSLADTLLPTRSGCPMGASGRLDNVTLPPGTYEVAVQQHPDATALPAGDAVFEVAMACDPATHSAANPAAMPVDPSRGGIAIDAVTGRLAVAPPADLAAALHGRYNLSIFAEDGAGVRVSMTTPPIEITLAERPPFAVRDAATSISAGCAAELARIRDRTSTLPYHHGQPTGVDGFNRDLCANRGLFAHYFADDEAGVSFQLRVRGAGATGPTTMRDAYASAETGRILIRPPPAAAPGTTADFVAVLQAVDGRGSRVNVSVWNVSVVDLDVPPLPIVRAVGGGTTGGPTTATATAYTTAADGSLSLSRSRWAIGTTYQLPSLSLVFADGRAPADAPVSFKLEPPQPGFFINTETGEVLGRPVAPSDGGARPPTAAQSTMYAVAEGFAPTPLGTFTFEFLPADVDNAANGPTGSACGGGDPVDAVEFDSNFTCVCYDGYSGANCDRATSLPTLVIADVSTSSNIDGSSQPTGTSSTIFAAYELAVSDDVGAPGWLSQSRSKWGVGVTYRLPSINVTASDIEDQSTIKIKIDPNPKGFFLNGDTGEMIGVVPDDRFGQSQNVVIYASVVGFQDAAIGNIMFGYLYRDVDNSSALVAGASINSTTCLNNGNKSDISDGVAEFDGVITCDCTDTLDFDRPFTGPDCGTQRADTTVASYGPNNESCGEHSIVVDTVEFNRRFDCECTDSYTGENCRDPPENDASSSDSEDDTGLTEETIYTISAVGGLCAVLLLAVVGNKAQGYFRKRRTTGRLYALINSTGGTGSSARFTDAMFDALDHRLDHLVPALVEAGADASARHPKTREQPHATLLARPQPDRAVLQSVFAAHCTIDAQTGTLLEDPSRMAIIEAVLAELAQNDWRDSKTAASVLHAVVQACRRGAIASKQAVAMSAALLAIDATLAVTEDSFGQTAGDYAMQCEDAEGLERLLTVVLHDTYQLAHPNEHLYRSKTAVIMECRILGAHRSTRPNRPLGRRKSSTLAADDLEAEQPLVIKLMADMESWTREIKLRIALPKTAAESIVGVLSIASADPSGPSEVGDMAVIRNSCSLFDGETAVRKRAQMSPSHILMEKYPFALVMERADRNLAEIITNEQLAAEQLGEIRRVANKIGACIAQLHESGICHGDIKPRNVVRSAGTRAFRLIDFDMSYAPAGNSQLPQLHPTAEKINSTSAFAAPELLRWSNAALGAPNPRTVGDRVRVRGYNCAGTLQYVGPHQQSRGSRVGVELDRPLGKNDGTVSGFRYFTCAPGHGLLTLPDKVSVDTAHTHTFGPVTSVKLDVWSFAVTLYEMATGVSLFPNAYDRGTPDAIARLLQWDGLRPEEEQLLEAREGQNSAPLVDFLRWALSPTLEERPADMRAVLAHAFFNPNSGAMREHFVVDRIRELLLPVTGSPPRPCVKVMISYCWDDTTFVLDRLCLALAPLVQGMWLDRLGGDQGMGEWTRESMDKGVAGADVVIAVVSPKYVRSKNCGFEMELADKHRKPVIPVVLGLPFAEWCTLKKVGDTELTTQFHDATTGDMKLFVDFTDRAKFETKFSKELKPRIMIAAALEGDQGLAATDIGFSSPRSSPSLGTTQSAADGSGGAAAWETIRFDISYSI